MARPHIEFIYAQALEWQEGTPLPGREDSAWKLLSRDPDLGEVSAIVRLAPDWSGAVTPDFQEELYILEGDLAIGDAPLRRDGYFRVPAGVPHRWSTANGAVVLVMLNQPSAEDAPDLFAIDTPAMAWDRSGVPEKLDFMGIARKALFVDADTGEHRTWLLSVAPQIAPSGALLATETHGCAEEVYMLAGEITGPQGAMLPGAYFWRPRETFHGPFGSRGGGLALSRFRHGKQTTVFHDRTRPFMFEAPYRPDLPAELSHLATSEPAPPPRF